MNCCSKPYAYFKQQEIVNPLFGPIDITKLGWRHITRQSRWYHYKMASFEILAILDKILQGSPTKHYMVKIANSNKGNICFREIEFLLYYQNIKIFDIESQELCDADVYVKLLEIGMYIDNWQQKPKDAIYTNRRVIFKSIYYKQGSQNMHA